MTKRSKSESHKWNMADTITSVRMAASLLLLFLPLRSAWFLTVYTLAGLTDALDGWLARKTGTASDFGARLDSMADLLFYAVLLFRLFPVLWRTLPAAVWYSPCAAGSLCHGCRQIPPVCRPAYLAEQADRSVDLPAALCACGVNRRWIQLGRLRACLCRGLGGMDDSSLPESVLR